jgi:hypothetical protein
MALAPSADNVILGAGELFWRPIVNGALTSYFHLGNCSRFAILLNDDIIKLKSSQTAERSLIKQVTRGREINIEILSNEYAIDNMALALMGDAGTFTQTSSAVTGEILSTSIVAGRFYRTAGRNITGVVINQGTVTWTVSTGYTVYDSSAGLIQVKSPAAGGVTTATPATIAYTRASLSLDTVLGATKTKVEGSLYFIPDPTTGPQFDVEVFYCSVSPSGEVAYISEEFGEYGLAIAALDDRQGVYGGTADMPYFRKIHRGTA